MRHSKVLPEATFITWVGVSASIIPALSSLIPSRNKAWSRSLRIRVWASIRYLRGVIVPIVDLRLKLGCDSAEYNHFTVVIVLNVRARVVGAVVDSVSDVLELGGDAIRPAPAMNASIDTSFITGIGSVNDRMLILMDIEALMGSADMGLMDDVVA